MVRFWSTLWKFFILVLHLQTDAKDFCSATTLKEKIGNLYSSLNVKSFDPMAIIALKYTRKYYDKHIAATLNMHITPTIKVLVEKIRELEEKVEKNAKTLENNKKNKLKLANLAEEKDRIESMKRKKQNLKENAEKHVAQILSRIYPSSSTEGTRTSDKSSNIFVCKDAIVNKMITDENLAITRGNTFDSKSIISIAGACESLQ
jgi:hypothetical protein